MGRCECVNCGAEVPMDRWHYGFKYCKSRECFEAVGKKDLLYEAPPDPEDVDLSPFELDGIASIYSAD